MILETVSLLLGLCIAIIRMCEPFVFHTFKDILRERSSGLTCSKRSKKARGLEESAIGAPDDESATKRTAIQAISVVCDLSENSKNPKAPQHNYSNDLNTFLNKAFNVEYVYLILTGIIRIMQAQGRKFQHFRMMK